MCDMSEFEKQFDGDEKIADLVTLVTGVDLPLPPPRPDMGVWGDPL